MLLAAASVAVLLQFVNSRFKPQPAAAVPKVAKPDFAYHYTPSQPKIFDQTNLAASGESEGGEATLPKIPRDKAESWLAKHNRNASSLLAAFRALGDTNYLNEAATNFPNDPQVEMAILSRNAYPEDRRK